ncbi:MULTISPECIES: ParB/RepB/Spo0J family partition protein [Pseudobutyrivibrio]|jgi:ParB family chromosome partitioning protein|uniref:Chromosome partitioning protein ParB n=2 Tax=Pseudobutyrivibrio TaxID=46205 RepID=A0A2G3DWQ9_9FIRM|nr:MULTISPECIES: ParB/RepB/Spo0J family partition protein [Pseudobutyrivibrio]MBR5952048.1 ParB/RepB/Spo0J family partition protein [Pseudobutyrivibrio sp.]NEX02052.1 ParB/RepB/Spo0J family partition protein [Pseudobutyrivibrio xylanivorans]PHU35466.1 chromosome partitioning protein ParB [Pseudobutyrivibrio ruminis]PHU40609.1 chromosome partitioning protein ParB [Pseudobutyrivibrio ruminis]SCY11524.1 chromosome partitioning protein, ParB family [Pseudobutyrivibrio sp. AR14]
MAAKKGGLGKGLDSLIVKKEEGVVAVNPEQHGAPVEVDINKVEPNKLQPRKNFDEDKLQELADNIKIHGIVNPIIVQDRKGYYEIIGGERRWRAARIAGFKKVPVIIMNLSEQEFVEISLIDNIQREQLNPIEEAMAFARLIDEFNLKQDEVAERVSKSRTTITNALRLLKLDKRVQDMIVDDKLSTGHARAMLAIADPDKQYEFAERAFDEKMSVRDVEREVKKLLNDKKSDKKSKASEIDSQLAAVYQETQERLKGVLGTKVFINAKDNKSGKLEIEYYSQDELNRIVELLENIK